MESIVHEIHLFSASVCVFSVRVSTISRKIHQDFKWRNTEFLRMFNILSISSRGISFMRSAPFNNVKLLFYLILALLNNTGLLTIEIHTALCAGHLL